jgi:hypothetical protein
LIPSGYAVLLMTLFGRVERFDGSNLSIDYRVGELSLEAFAEGKSLSFHVDVLIFTFYFVINTKPHFAQQETLL